MATSATPELTIRPGSAGRFYVLEGHKVIARCTTEDEAQQFLSVASEAPEVPTITVLDWDGVEDEGNYAEYVNAMYEIAADMGAIVVRVAA